MLPPNNMPLGQLAKEEGISVATLAKWRAEGRAKRQFLPDANAGPEGWTSRDKHGAVIEAASMNEAELGGYCRRRGIYPEQLAVWREACDRANDGSGRPAAGSLDRGPVRLLPRGGTAAGLAGGAEHSDRAISGASMFRAGIEALQRDAKAGRFDIVLSEGMDRLSRKLSDISRFHERMEHAGVRIWSIT
ncbi:recombinase family protein [Cereibacter sphaeroides]|uniref:recombinase family protein n=1 Tax=Cereibacter sphaeroides TaxID=1063 RepID=UPI001F25A675|nr:recombinase family protein [Cereibacter sphaeroides]MCE6951075.1 recombinase family protein [Cereibacter sphaeroides]